MASTDRVVLSVVLRVVGGKPFVRRCLSSLKEQIGNRAIEVIVPHDANDSDVSRLKREFPQFFFLNVGGLQTSSPVATPAAAHELCDRQTSKGLAVARGEIVALVEDDATPARDWCEQILDAHKLPYDIIGGAVEHSGRGTVNWAVYFLDFGRYQLPLSEGPTGYLTDVNVSYKRAALGSVKEVWEQKYNEVVVHRAFAKKGAVLWRRPQIVVYQDRGFLSFSRQLRERFAWGNLFAAVRVREMTLPRRLLYVLLSPAIPLVLTARMAKKVFVTGRNRWRFVLSLPVFLSLGSVWCVGELFAYLSGRPYFQGSRS
jgi:glycosyl transferase family 2